MKLKSLEDTAIQCGLKKPDKPTKPMVIRRVICAACKHPLDNGVMLVGARHWDKVMVAQFSYMDGPDRPSGGQWEQGFIDQFGAFMDRQEAMEVAKEAGQPIDITRGCGGDDRTLYSEGLY